jgi:hypothetical protein
MAEFCCCEPALNHEAFKLQNRLSSVIIDPRQHSTFAGPPRCKANTTLPNRKTIPKLRSKKTDKEERA